MFNFNILFIFITIFFLFICSYTDIKTRTISNKLILFFLIFSFLLKIMQTILEKNISILLVVLLSFVITFVVCYIFWELGIIAGGDLKLLLVISILFPQITIFSKTLPIFPIILMLVGFLVLALYILIFSLIKLFSKNKSHLLKKIIYPQQAKQMLFTTFLLFFVSSFLNIFRFHLSFLVLFLLSFILVVFFSKIIKRFNKTVANYLLAFLYVLLLVYSLIFKDVVFEASSFIFLIVTIFLINFIISLIKIITKEILVDKKKINFLKEGDVPVYSYYLINQKLHKKKHGFLQTIKLMLENKYYKNLKIDSNKAGGLNKQDITFLKRMYKDNLIERDILVKKTVPFTPTLLIAYLLLIFI